MKAQNVIALLVAEANSRSDRHRKRLRQTYADHRNTPPWPRHQGHDRDQTSERNGKVVAATLVEASDEIMLITTGGV
jgi:DNA gyrase subunit A